MLILSLLTFGYGNFYTAVPLKPISSDTINLYPENKTAVEYENPHPDTAFAHLLDTVFAGEATIRTAYAGFVKLLPQAQSRKMTSDLFAAFYRYKQVNRISVNDVNYDWYCTTWRNAGLATSDDFLKRCYSDCFYEEFYEGTYATPLLDTKHWETADTIYPGLLVRDSTCTIRFTYEIDRLEWNTGYSNARYRLIDKGTAEADWHKPGTPVYLATPGYYRVTIYTNDNFRVFYLQKGSPVRAVAFSDNRTLFIKAFSAPDSPVNQFRIILFWNDTAIIRKSHKDGTLAITFNKPAKEQCILEAFIEHDGYITPLHISLDVIDQRNRTSAHVYTDRTWYRPGDMVHIGGLVKNFTDATSFSPIPLDSVCCRITGSYSKRCRTDVVPVNTMGHFSDSLRIPDNAALESYSVAIEPRESFTGRFPALLKTDFDVAQYNTPACIVRCTSDKSTFGPDDTVSLDISGRYLLGAPLRYAPCTVFSDAQGYLIDTMLRPVYPQRYVYHPAGTEGHKRLLDIDDRVLDGAGSYTGRFAADSSFSTGFYTIYAQVKGHDKRTYQGSRQVFIAPALPVVSCFGRAVLKRDSSIVTVSVFVTDENGFPVAATATCSLTDSANIVTLPELRMSDTGVIRFSFSDRNRRCWIASVIVNPDGSAAQHHPLFIRPDRYFHRPYKNSLEIIADRTAYRRNDTIMVRVYWPSRVIGKTVFSGSILMKNYRNAADDDSDMYAIPITPECGSTYFITALCFDTAINEILTEHKQLSLEPDSSLLLTVTGTSPSRFKPGRRCTLKYTVTDRDHAPVKASFSAAVVDEAVFAIKPENDSGMLGSMVHGNYQYPCSTFFSKPVGMRQQLKILELLGNTPSLVNSSLRQSASPFRFGYGETESCTDHRASFRYRRRGIAGIGYGAGYGSGFGGGSDNLIGGMAGIDDLVGGLMGGDGGGGLILRKRGSLRISSPEFTKGGIPVAQVQHIRKYFTDQAFWAPQISTDRSGHARITFTMPDNLTTWRIRLRGSDGGKFLLDHTDSCIVQLPLMLHLELPRFGIVNDQGTVFTVLFNQTDTLLPVRITLTANRGATLAGRSTVDTLIGPRDIATLYWPITMTDADSCVITATAASTTHTDGERRAIPLHPYSVSMHTGSLVLLIDSQTVTLTLPPEFMPGKKVLTLDATNDRITALLPTLHYLMIFPHGCVEQTMSRFLPDLYVARFLKEQGIKNDSLSRLFAPAFIEGISLLEGYQHADGGWGWWKDDKSTPVMTALVVRGLYFALSTGPQDILRDRISVMLDRALPRVVRYLDSLPGDDDGTIQLLGSLAESPHLAGVAPCVTSLVRHLENLPTIRCAALLECVNALHDDSAVAACINELVTRSVTTPAGVVWPPYPAHQTRKAWEATDVHTTAMVLSALATAQPAHPLIPAIQQWLYSKNDGIKWVSTATTAEVIRAISRSTPLYASGTGQPKFRIAVNGVPLPRVRTKTTAGSVRIDAPDSLMSLSNRIFIVNQSKHPAFLDLNLYYEAHPDCLQRDSQPIGISRTYYRIDQTGRRFAAGAAVLSGDELECVLTLQTDTDRSYVCIEEPLPAGMEQIVPDEIKPSGICTHMEYRTDRVIFYCSIVPAGKHTLRFSMRAQFPGGYRILPSSAQCMYNPEIKGYSPGGIIRIRDR